MAFANGCLGSIAPRGHFLDPVTGLEAAADCVLQRQLQRRGIGRLGQRCRWQQHRQKTTRSARKWFHEAVP
jgi:hypothetical protein